MKRIGPFGNRTRSIRRNVHALYLAVRRPDVPVIAKVVIGLVIAYALSPIDLVPDFIPVLGWLDDVVLVPLGLWLAIRLIPGDIWQACQAQAHTGSRRTAVLVIVSVWAIVVALVLWLFFASGQGA